LITKAGFHAPAAHHLQSICNTKINGVIPLAKPFSLTSFRRAKFPSLYFSKTIVMFVWLISHRPAVFFSQNKPAVSNHPAVLFSQNKSAPAISHHQPPAKRTG
jgi:hypothetical protein